jgi:hypothetical protein
MCCGASAPGRIGQRRRLIRLSCVRPALRRWSLRKAVKSYVNSFPERVERARFLAVLDTRVS